MEAQVLQKLIQIEQVFRPSAPIDKLALFAGRVEQLKKIGSAIAQPGQHAIVFGERGVGKTSLTNVISDLYSQISRESVRYARVNCDSGDRFETIWRKVFREMSFIVERREIGLGRETRQVNVNVAQLLPPDVNVTPDDVRYAFQQIGGQTTVVIDEIDRIQDSETTILLADTIKSLSDNLAGVTLILVGVAESIDELIAEHKSVERALIQVKMPRMSDDELYEIVDKALQAVEMIIEPLAREQIADLSQGLPHFTHSLGLYATQHAAENHRQTVDIADVKIAIRKSVENVQQSVQNQHHKATISARKTIYAQLLLACALANLDEMGTFAAKDVRQPMSKIMGKRYEITGFARILHDLCEDGRGSVLTKSGLERRLRYRFTNPMLQPFVIMKGLRDGYISEEDVQNVFRKGKSRQERLWKENE